MDGERIVTAGDKRARSLQLNPRPKQNNTFGRGFTCSKPMSDIDKVDAERRYRVCEGTDRMRQKIRMF